MIESIMREHPNCADVLAEQFRLAEIAGRRGTGVGCYTDFDVPESAPRLPDDAQYPFSSPPYFLKSADAIDLSEEVSFDIPDDFRRSVMCGALLIHNQRGVITYLECYTYTAGSWPEEVYDMWFELPGASN